MAKYHIFDMADSVEVLVRILNKIKDVSEINLQNSSNSLTQVILYAYTTWSNHLTLYQLK